VVPRSCNGRACEKLGKNSGLQYLVGLTTPSQLESMRPLSKLLDSLIMTSVIIARISSPCVVCTMQRSNSECVTPCQILELGESGRCR
jgi:hypothetical protein